MENLKTQTNTQNLESSNSAALLTEGELKSFRKLSAKEKKKQQEDKLQKLEELQNKFRKAVEEANKTGKVEEAQKLKIAFAEKAEELKQLIAETEKLEAKFWKVGEIIPDKEITSARTAIRKLQKEGYTIDDYAKKRLNKVDWKENIKDSYEIVFVRVPVLFGDNEEHTYKAFVAKALKSGLELVPEKLVPSIRLYGDKIMHCFIATEAEEDSDGHYSLFRCGPGPHEPQFTSLTISGTGGNYYSWQEDHVFLFVRK